MLGFFLLKSYGIISGKLCDDNPNCNYWTFLGINYDGNQPKLRCWLKTEKGNTIHLEGAISGDKDCHA